MGYVGPAILTMGLTAVMVLFPIWRRGGRAALVETSGRWIPLFIVLGIYVPVLIVLLQSPAQMSVQLVIFAAMAMLSAYHLTRPEDRKSRGRLGLYVFTLIVAALGTVYLILA